MVAFGLRNHHQQQLLSSSANANRHRVRSARVGILPPFRPAYCPLAIRPWLLWPTSPCAATSISQNKPQAYLVHRQNVQASKHSQFVLGPQPCFAALRCQCRSTRRLHPEQFFALSASHFGSRHSPKRLLRRNLDDSLDVMREAAISPYGVRSAA